MYGCTKSTTQKNHLYEWMVIMFIKVDKFIHKIVNGSDTMIKLKLKFGEKNVQVQQDVVEKDYLEDYFNDIFSLDGTQDDIASVSENYEEQHKGEDHNDDEDQLSEEENFEESNER